MDNNQNSSRPQLLALLEKLMGSQWTKQRGTLPNGQPVIGQYGGLTIGKVSGENPYADWINKGLMDASAFTDSIINPIARKYGFEQGWQGLLTPEERQQVIWAQEIMHNHPQNFQRFPMLDPMFRPPTPGSFGKKQPIPQPVEIPGGDYYGPGNEEFRKEHPELAHQIATSVQRGGELPRFVEPRLLATDTVNQTPSVYGFPEVMSPVPQGPGQNMSVNQPTNFIPFRRRLDEEY